MPAPGVGSGAVGGAAAEKTPKVSELVVPPKTLPQEPGGCFARTLRSPSRAWVMERRHLPREQRRLSTCLVCRMCCIG